MSREHEILQILADGKFQSGEAIGKEMGVSRSAIWKIIKKIERLELDLHIVHGRGYRIGGGLELFTKEKIEQTLSAQSKEILDDIIIFDVLDSTNSYLLERAKTETKVIACVAESQTAGRGRQGRTWVSPFGANIALSLLWQFSCGMSQLNGLSLVIGIAIYRALIEEGVPPEIGLKWPNDIIHEQGKLGGILVEMQGELSGPCRVVIGVGINVRMPEHIAIDIDQDWLDVQSLSSKILRRNELLAAIMNHTIAILTEFSDTGIKSFVKEWNKLDKYRDQAVTIITPNKSVDGIERGVDESGQLCVEINGKIEKFNHGEVSLRRRVE